MMDEINEKIVSQKGRNTEQDQNIWSSEPTEPQDLQQYGVAEAYAFAKWRGVKYHLVSNFWYCSIWLAQAEDLCAHCIALFHCSTVNCLLRSTSHLTMLGELVNWSLSVHKS